MNKKEGAVDILNENCSRYEGGRAAVGRWLWQKKSRPKAASDCDVGDSAAAAQALRTQSRSGQAQKTQSPFTKRRYRGYTNGRRCSTAAAGKRRWRTPACRVHGDAASSVTEFSVLSATESVIENTIHTVGKPVNSIGFSFHRNESPGGSELSKGWVMAHSTNSMSTSPWQGRGLHQQPNTLPCKACKSAIVILPTLI